MTGRETRLRDLNNSDSVSEIVATFTHDLLSRLSDDGFTEWLEAECRKLNMIFIGGGLHERPYRTDVDWNNPDRLGFRVQLRLGISGEQRYAVRDAFMVLANELATVVIERGDQPIEDWGWELDALQEKWVRALLDAPSGDEDDPD